MSKRANGEGTITKRSDGRWVASLMVARCRKWLYGKTRGDVAEKLTAALKDRQDGLPVPGERLTVDQMLNWWLAKKVKPKLRVRSYLRYEQLVRIHIKPRIGLIPVTRLTVDDVEQLYSDAMADGLSPRSTVQLHAVLRKALKDAEKKGLVARNVCTLAERPSFSQREMKTLTRSEARTLVDAVSGDRMEALFVLALTTGLRQGELLALRWRNVDLDAARLEVVATLQRVDGAPVFGEPKTPKSRRRVSLSATATAALRSHRGRQAEERLKAVAWEDGDVVFSDEVGRPYDASRLRREFWAVLERAGLPRIRFHDLRHTAATLLMAENQHAKIVSELLGHSTTAITLDLYSHVTPTMQEEAAIVMDGIVSGH